MAEPKTKDLLWDPIFNRNPIALGVLGVCSALAVTGKMQTAFVMTLCGFRLTSCSWVVNFSRMVSTKGTMKFRPPLRTRLYRPRRSTT